MIVCAGNNETFSFATPVGVGLCESASNLTRLVLMHPPEFLLFIGSAGTYGEHEIFDIVESRAASQLELSYLQKKSYTPLQNNLIVSERNVSRETPLYEMLSQKELSIVNSSNYITTDIDIGSRFNRLGIGLENMEFYSVMLVAQLYEIPCGGVFVITNRCDENAHEDFLKNHEKAMKLLVEYLERKVPDLENIDS